MQRDVKIGIAIGVLLIALIAVFWWARKSSHPVPQDTVAQTRDGELPPPAPVAPPVGNPGVEVGPVVAGTTPLPTPPVAVTPPTGPGPVPGPGAVMPPMGPVTAVTPVPPPPPPPPAAAKTYKVKSGDTLSSIAKEFYGKESKFQLIYKANKDKLKSPDDLKEGMVLTIPADAAGATPPPSTGAAPAPVTPSAGAASKPTPGQKYVVAPGDTLTGIARKAYGSSAPADIEANIKRIYLANKGKLSSPDDLQVGMELMIPPASH